MEENNEIEENKQNLTKEEKMKEFIKSRKNQENAGNKGLRPPKSKGKSNSSKRFISNGGGLFAGK